MTNTTGGVRVNVSPFPFIETMDRLQSLIVGRGLRLFDTIDHDAAAAAVGLDLRPTRVLIFGNPVGGTPLINEWPALALELPLRIAVWQDEDQRVRVAHLTQDSLVAQFELDPTRAATLGVPADIIAHLITGV